MDTRSLHIFANKKGDTDYYAVYKHSDGYPIGVTHLLEEAIHKSAFALPRFEPSDLACAFIWEVRNELIVRYPDSPLRGGGCTIVYPGDVAGVQGIYKTYKGANYLDVEYVYKTHLNDNIKLVTEIYKVNDYLSETPIYECVDILLWDK